MANEIQKHDWVEQAREAFLSGQIEVAAALFRRATEVDATNSDAWNGLATSLCELNSGSWSEEAVDCLMIAIKTDPKNLKAWNNLADFYNRRGEVDQAIEYMEKALSLDPANGVTLGNLGLAYRRRERFEESFGVFEQGLRVNARCGWTAYQLAIAFLSRGSVQGIAADFDRARELLGFIRNNQSELQNVPEESELRFLETCLTMEKNSPALRAMLVAEEGEVREENTEEYQGQAVN